MTKNADCGVHVKLSESNKSIIMLPGHADINVFNKLDSQKLWTAVGEKDCKVNSKFSNEFIGNVPIEWSMEGFALVVKRFAEYVRQQHGAIVEAAMHYPKNKTKYNGKYLGWVTLHHALRRAAEEIVLPQESDKKDIFERKAYAATPWMSKAKSVVPVYCDPVLLKRALTGIEKLEKHLESIQQELKKIDINQESGALFSNTFQECVIDIDRLNDVFGKIYIQQNTNMFKYYNINIYQLLDVATKTLREKMDKFCGKPVRAFAKN